MYIVCVCISLATSCSCMQMKSELVVCKQIDFLGVISGDHTSRAADIMGRGGVSEENSWEPFPRLGAVVWRVACWPPPPPPPPPLSCYLPHSWLWLGSTLSGTRLICLTDTTVKHYSKIIQKLGSVLPCLLGTWSV